MPDLLIALVILTTLFALAAGLKAAWHGNRLRSAGEKPLGLGFRGLPTERKK